MTRAHLDLAAGQAAQCIAQDLLAGRQWQRPVCHASQHLAAQLSSRGKLVLGSHAGQQRPAQAGEAFSAAQQGLEDRLQLWEHCSCIVYGCHREHETQQQQGRPRRGGKRNGASSGQKHSTLHASMHTAYCAQPCPTCRLYPAWPSVAGMIPAAGALPPAGCGRRRLPHQPWQQHCLPHADPLGSRSEQRGPPQNDCMPGGGPAHSRLQMLVLRAPCQLIKQAPALCTASQAAT